MGRCILRALAILLVLLVSPLGATQAEMPVRVQLGFVVDGSKSMHPTNFALLKYGLAHAIGRQDIVPRDGSVEVCVVQIGASGTFGGRVHEELQPIVVTPDTIGLIQSTLRNMQQGQGYTPTAGGIRACTRMLTGSPNFAAAQRSAINVATDGMPFDRLKFPDADESQAYALSIEDALAARDEALASGIDELDAEALGDLGQRPSQLPFFKDLVYPQPAHLIPPDAMAPGFVRIVIDYADFGQAVSEKLQVVLRPGPTPTATSAETATPTAVETLTQVPDMTATSPVETPTPSPTPVAVPEDGSGVLLVSGLIMLLVYGGAQLVRQGVGNRLA